MLEHPTLQIPNCWRILTCRNCPTLGWCSQWQLWWQWLRVSDRRWLASTMQKRLWENPGSGGANCSWGQCFTTFLSGSHSERKPLAFQRIRRGDDYATKIAPGWADDLEDGAHSKWKRGKRHWPKRVARQFPWKTWKWAAGKIKG